MTRVAIDERNIKSATAQEVYDFIVARLREQGMRSFSVRGTSEYRGPRGLRSPAGWLISDEAYTPRMEGRTWRQIVRKMHLYPDAHFELIDWMQRVYQGVPVPQWERAFAQVAGRFGLKLAAKMAGSVQKVGRAKKRERAYKGGSA